MDTKYKNLTFTNSLTLEKMVDCYNLQNIPAQDTLKLTLTCQGGGGLVNIKASNLEIKYQTRSIRSHKFMFILVIDTRFVKKTSKKLVFG